MDNAPPDDTDIDYYTEDNGHNIWLCDADCGH
jgi:hypothetical protein